MNKLSKNLLMGIAGLGVALSALAMSPGGRGDCDYTGPRYEQMEGHDGMRGNSPDAKERVAHREARRAQREAALHDKLKLSADQEAAWNKFVDNKPEAGPKRPFKRGEMANLTAPERMEKMLEMMKARYARMADRLEEVKTFYSVLTPEQKAIFDQEFGPSKRARPGFGRQ